MMQKSALTWGTCLAIDFIRSMVFTVVKEITAQSGADASTIGTWELILLACGKSWRSLCKHNTHRHTHTSQGVDGVDRVDRVGVFPPIWLTPQLTAVQFIWVVTAVIDTVASLRHLQAYTVILAAESPCGRTLKPPWEPNRETTRGKGGGNRSEP